MRLFTRPKCLISTLKITSLIDTDGKGKFRRMLSFLLLDKGRLFFTKLFFEVLEIFFTVEHLDCFEMQPSSKVFEESQVHFVLYSEQNCVSNLKGNLCFCKYFMDVLCILRSA